MIIDRCMFSMNLLGEIFRFETHLELWTGWFGEWHSASWGECNASTYGGAISFYGSELKSWRSAQLPYSSRNFAQMKVTP